MSKNMKIKVEFTVEMDAQKFADEYQIELSEVSAEVKEKMFHEAYSSVDSIGIECNAKLKR